MRAHHLLIVSSLLAAACEDEVANNTENAAERVRKAANHLRHERTELAHEVAQRADARFAGRDLTAHVGDITAEVKDVNREAGKLASALQDYEALRALRVQTLLTAHAIASSQPLMIEAVAQVKPLLPVERSRLDETLAIFRERLASTRPMIEKLERVPAADWERSDDDLARAMAGLFLARDASWQALDDSKRDDRIPET